MGGKLDLTANLSSQYVSSILMAGIKAKEVPLVLNLVGEAAVSKPYIEMTLAMMDSFGVKCEISNDFRSFLIPQVPYYNNPLQYNIECDASSATYPLCIAALVRSYLII